MWCMAAWPNGSLIVFGAMRACMWNLARRCRPWKLKGIGIGDFCSYSGQVGTLENHPTEVKTNGQSDLRWYRAARYRAEDIILPEEYKAELRTLHDQAATFDFPEVGLGTTPAVSCGENACAMWEWPFSTVATCLVWRCAICFQHGKHLPRHESQEENYLRRILIAAAFQGSSSDSLNCCHHVVISYPDHLLGFLSQCRFEVW